jgi:hypothetical protein
MPTPTSPRYWSAINIPAIRVMEFRIFCTVGLHDPLSGRMLGSKAVASTIVRASVSYIGARRRRPGETGRGRARDGSAVACERYASQLRLYYQTEARRRARGIVICCAPS